MDEDGKEIDIENVLLQGKELSYKEIVSLRDVYTDSVSKKSRLLQRAYRFVSLAQVKKLI